ncbi:MAG: hypothetical protein ACTSWW_06380 [Promethearchaeota archaeon]
MELKIAFGNQGTVVDLSQTHKRVWRHYRKADGSRVKSVKILAYDTTLSTKKLLQDHEQDFSTKLKNEDFEVDIESAGKIIPKTKRIVVDKNFQPVYAYKEMDILRKPSGEEIRRDHQTSKANINEVIPVVVSDNYLHPKEVLLKYVFQRSYFLIHKDDTSYGFLFELAKFLADRNQFARVFSFNPETKEPEPLVLYQGGTLFSAAFLEGRIRDKEYCLILHLSDRELKLVST